MNKKQICITLGIMCFILTFAICIQIRTINTANSTASQTLTDNGLRDEVLKWKEKYDNAYEELKKSEKTLEEVRQKATKNDDSSSKKEEELKINNTLLGLTNVKGSGIIIKLQDANENDSLATSDNISKKLIHNGDLLAVVNELKNAGAEAIEINNQRITNTSSITCEGNVTKINGEKIGSPFEIKAIGSQGLLYGQLTRPGSYLSLMSDDGIIVEVSKSDDISIEKYKGVVNFEYIKAIK